MTSPHWHGAEAAARATRAAQESGRLAGSSGGGCLMSTVLTLVVAIAFVTVAVLLGAAVGHAL
ncbi:hypothetical protein [Nocardia xishanensis]